MRTPVVGAIIVMLGMVAAAAQQPTSNMRANDTWIAISGTVTAASPDSFLLDYGGGTVTVEVDDWDWYSEGCKLLKGDTVRVHGFIDDDLYETTTIEASSVYAQNLGTYFFAGSSDEEDPYLPFGVGLHPTVTTVTGTVTGIDGRTFTLDTGPRQLTVDTRGMPYNPLDAEGYQQVKKGDRVSISGRMTKTFFNMRQLTATAVVSLSRQKNREMASPVHRK